MKKKSFFQNNEADTAGLLHRGLHNRRDQTHCQHQLRKWFV